MEGEYFASETSPFEHLFLKKEKAITKSSENKYLKSSIIFIFNLILFYDHICFENMKLDSVPTIIQVMSDTHLYTSHNYQEVLHPEMKGFMNL